MKWFAACLVILLVPAPAMAQWSVIQGFAGIQAEQKGEQWCWAAALQIAAAAQRVTLSQDEIVKRTGNKEPGATYQDIQAFLRAGWRGQPGDPSAWTVDTDSFRSAPPDQMLARFFQIGRPVILAYRTGPTTAHAIVAFGGFWTKGQPFKVGPAGLMVSRDNEDRFIKLRIFDPATGKPDDEDEWDVLRRGIIGAWSPIIMKRDGCNVFGPGVNLPPNCNSPVRGGGVF